MGWGEWGKTAQVELHKSQPTLALSQASQYLPDTWLCRLFVCAYRFACVSLIRPLPIRYRQRTLAVYQEGNI